MQVAVPADYVSLWHVLSGLSVTGWLWMLRAQRKGAVPARVAR